MVVSMGSLSILENLSLYHSNTSASVLHKVQLVMITFLWKRRKQKNPRNPLRYVRTYICISHSVWTCMSIMGLHIWQVYLQASHRELVGVLELSVDPRPQRVDRVFHFYHPERTFLKKVIDIDTEHPLFTQDFGTERSKSSNNGVGKIFACASDPEVNCEIRSKVSVCVCMHGTTSLSGVRLCTYTCDTTVFLTYILRYPQQNL